jgi:hypothetical protein
MSTENTSQPAQGWTCFHCGDTFHTHDAARSHFDATPTGVPDCLAKRNSVPPHSVAGLGRITNEDDGFVTLQFINEAAADAFMESYVCSVDITLMPSLVASTDSTDACQTESSWVKCPICGETNMHREAEPNSDGGGYIHCVNLACASNGGTNDSAMAKPTPVNPAEGSLDDARNRIKAHLDSIRAQDDLSAALSSCGDIDRLAAMFVAEIRQGNPVPAALHAMVLVIHQAARGEQGTEGYVAERLRLAARALVTVGDLAPACVDQAYDAIYTGRGGGFPMFKSGWRAHILHDGARAAAQVAKLQRAVTLDDALFEQWWEDHGQFCRAGGGEYEKTFAYRAWENALRRAKALLDLCSAPVAG